MKRFFGKAALAACLLAGVSSASQAQTVHPNEWTEYYADIRGWTVNAIIHAQGGFVGCRAVKTSRNGHLIVERHNGIWQLVVPTDRTDVYGGAILSIDKADIDSQFGFENGWATRELSARELDLIKAGNQLGVEINGEPPRYWELSGSTAAILKAQECADNGGNLPQDDAQAASGQGASGQAAPPPPPPPGRPPQTVTATCDSVPTGPYGCEITQMPEEPGYKEIYQIAGSNGAPAYFIKVKSDNRADVWASFDGAPWRYLGVWGNVGPNCSEPLPNQSSEARDNLGQDAWNLCIR